MTGCQLVPVASDLRGAEGDRNRGLELLAQSRDMAVRRQYLGSELPVVDVYLGGNKPGAATLTVPSRCFGNQCTT